MSAMETVRGRVSTRGCGVLVFQGRDAVTARFGAAGLARSAGVRACAHGQLGNQGRGMAGGIELISDGGCGQEGVTYRGSLHRNDRIGGPMAILRWAHQRRRARRQQGGTGDGDGGTYRSGSRKRARCGGEVKQRRRLMQCHAELRCCCRHVGRRRGGALRRQRPRLRWLLLVSFLSSSSPLSSVSLG
jgi:hypothetical protein